MAVKQVYIEMFHAWTPERSPRTMPCAPPRFLPPGPHAEER
jgi:hypothetical protein